MAETKKKKTTAKKKTTKTTKKVASKSKKTVSKVSKPKFVDDIKVLLGALGVIAILMIPVALFGTDGTTSNASSILRQIRNGECLEIYELQSTEAFRENVPEDNWVNGCSRVSAVLQGSPQLVESIRNDDVDTQQADVRYLIEGTDNKIYQVTVVVEREDGVWKMANFDSFTARQQA